MPVQWTSLCVPLALNCPFAVLDYGNSSPSLRPWKKRYRRGEITDSRQASVGRKSALEAAFRRSTERGTNNVITPSLGMEFDSIPEAHDDYNLYSWEIGVSIRYGWYIHEFRKEHNHGLSLNRGQKMHWSQCRNRRTS